MKTVLSAAAVLAFAGAASAAPFVVAGYTLANDGTSFTGITVSQGSFVRGPLFASFAQEGRLVATSNQANWDKYKGFLTGATVLGAFSGEAPLDITTIGPTPGGSTSPGFAQMTTTQSVLNNGGWFRAGLGVVPSATANIIGEGQYVWLGQLGHESGAAIGGDFTLLTAGSDANGGINRTEVNTGVANALGLIAFTVEIAPGVSHLYVTDVPAPGAVALLGVAGLAATRRRR